MGPIEEKRLPTAAALERAREGDGPAKISWALGGAEEHAYCRVQHVKPHHSRSSAELLAERCEGAAVPASRIRAPQLCCNGIVKNLDRVLRLSAAAGSPSALASRARRSHRTTHSLPPSAGTPGRRTAPHQRAAR